MSADVRPLPAPRQARLLPPAPGADRPLLFVIAIIVALAAMSAIATRATFAAAGAWTEDLEGAMTVQVSADLDQDPYELALEAARIVAATPGVTDAKPVSRAELEALLEPWFGDDGLPNDAPLLGLVDVQVDALTPPKAEALEAVLAAAGLRATVDDHTEWTRQVRDAADLMRLIALGVLLALVVAAAAVTSFATRASLAARADVVNVLHLVGATDAYVADAFTHRFLALGLRAGLLGAFIAGLCAALLIAMADGAQIVEVVSFLPHFNLGVGDVIILALTPLGAAGVAAGTARETVLRALKDVY